MSDEPRLRRPDRSQLSWDVVDLDSQVPDDHPVRAVWAFVQALDVSPLERDIKAREGHPGRPTPDRRLYLALWLYATIDGVGSARALDRLCRQHCVYRWFCGGVSVNYHDLSDFRVEAGEFLDDLLSKSVTALVAQGVVSLDCLAVDSMRVRASAGSGSFRRGERLLVLHEMAKNKVAALRKELDDDPGAGSRREQSRRQRAAEERETRVAAAKRALEEIEAERAKEAESQRRKDVKRKEARASTTDPEARVMKTGDGGFRPAYSFHVKTAPKSGIVVGFSVTNRASDRGQLTPAVKEIERRYGVQPKQLLADGGFDGKDDIEHLYGDEAGAIEVFCPLPGSDGKLGDPTPKRGDGPGVIAWRKRMSSEQGLQFYRQRFGTERPHGDMRNRGLTRLRVRGLQKARAVGLWYVLAYNFLQSRFLATHSAQPMTA